MSTLTLNLDERYTEALDALALDADMSKTAVLRAAIRLYQFVQSRRCDGYELAFTKDGKTHPMILIDHRLPGFDSND
jgi:predicted transcriptional regulator